jgi:2-dehydropantoate 2-reductase
LESGADVVLIRRNREHVNVIRDQGLKLEGVSGDRTLRPEIVADPAEAGTVDLALVLVKAYDTSEAVGAVDKILAPNGVVLTLQNGIGNFEILDKAFPGRVLMGTTTNGALALAPGKVRHTGVGQTLLGEADGSTSERALQVTSLLEKIKAGPVQVVNNAMGCVWSKLIVSAAINAPATLLRVRNGDLPATESGKALIHGVVEECLKVVQARGIALVFDDPEAHVIAVCQATAPNINSMFQDIRAGRRTEIDFINAALSREGEQLGIATPVNRTLAQLIQSLEQTTSVRVADPS